MEDQEEFYEEEGVSEKEVAEQDVYDNEGVAGAMDDDGISPEEEGFMQGYNGSSKDEKEK